jgi:hypothetical protein
MGWPAHNPELYDDLQKQAFLEIMSDLLGGELPDEICQNIHDKENFYYWMEKKFGPQFALTVCQEAEANYWSGLVEDAMQRMEAYYG